MNLVWFRHDLRTVDHPALWAALDSGQPVRAVYVASPAQWRSHDWGDARLDFVQRSVQALARALGALGIALDVLVLDTFADIPAGLLAHAQRHRVRQVFAHEEYEWHERQRDAACQALWSAQGIGLQLLPDQCVWPPGRVRNGQGQFYRVFTPFFRQWRLKLAEAPAQVLPTPQPQLPSTPADAPADQQALWSKSWASAVPACQPFWPAGPEAAQQRLQQFLQAALGQYAEGRDRADQAATSRLSADLSVGSLSVRQVLVALRSAWQAGVDPEPFIRQLAWRDFYRHVLVGFPWVSRGQPFDLQVGRRLQWRNDPAAFERWCQGQTGVPIVDAGMRALRAEGWLHNRLRMVVAMYLCKDLHIDWRWGERFFMQQLVDADLANNNGGWQWCASTGTDAQPYFRIMNPYSQSQKIDPAGTYIRRHVPELAALAAPAIHQPPPGLRRTLGYPAELVDHATARTATLALFERARQQDPAPLASPID